MRGSICTYCGREVYFSTRIRGTDILLCRECYPKFSSEYDSLIEKYLKFYRPSSFDCYIEGRKFDLNG